jgi:integrase
MNETPKRVIGRPWQPGQSGNPAGRPLGARHKITEAIIQDISGAWQTHGPQVLNRLEPISIKRRLASAKRCRRQPNVSAKPFAHRKSASGPWLARRKASRTKASAGYQRMVARAGEAAGFPFLIHSHMLRHSCGYKLANDGQDTRAIQHYLGHKSIMSTVRYTALAPDRFKGFWKD